MRTARVTGRNAAVLKYDLLTALGTHACAGDKHLQRLVLRFITLIVARYNWQADELSVGQREMAALWSVDERTVKRDIARLRSLGWLVIKREAARGRVAQHGLGIDAIVRMTQGCWDRVGTDYVGRMTEAEPSVPRNNVVTFPGTPKPEGQGIWAEMQKLLHAENGAQYHSWFKQLVPEVIEDRHLRLVAPTRFHADFVATHYIGQIRTLLHAMATHIETLEIVSA
ncbi:MAG: hypothetical protein DI533_16640 [Cereibacter sphaeroides]|uniref:DnaA N-terminal domain-containing protein n=1 Tax=Cereibacter sphaeroides TaxID=1063 RepID=A0A2W5RZK1_CERSP|nr:MAG: hypothetical protein DI533_16640 [Cereibacter sphaeroides]